MNPMSHSEASSPYTVFFFWGRLIASPVTSAYMRRCPQCGSSDLFQTTGGYLGSEYGCKKCGYRGAFIVESEEEMPHPEGPDNSEERAGHGIPLWIRILALVILLVFVWIIVPGW